MTDTNDHTTHDHSHHDHHDHDHAHDHDHEHHHDHYPKVTLKTLDGLVRELVIEISADEFKKEIDSQLRRAGKKLTLKGFRPGKAPAEMIRAAYGEEAKTEAIDHLIRHTLPVAAAGQKLRVASTPSVTAFDMTDDGGFTYTARVEVFPEITKVALDGISVPTIDIEPTDEEVNAAIEELRFRRAEYRTVTRAVTENDIVVAELRKTFDPNKVLEKDHFPDAAIDLQNPNTAPEFKSQLPGKSAGDEFEVEISFPDEHPNPKAKGAKLRYQVNIKEVQERLLPEMDDSLAKATNLGTTVLEMRLKVREELKSGRQAQLERQQKRELIRLVTDKNEIDLPQGLIDDYLDNVIEDLKKKDPKLDEAAARDEYRPGTVANLRWELIHRSIADQEKIEVSAAETDNWIKGYAEYHRMTAEQAADSFARSGQQDRVIDSIREEKVLSWLLEKAAKVPYTPPTAG